MHESFLYCLHIQFNRKEDAIFIKEYAEEKRDINGQLQVGEVVDSGWT
jgi:hypothetical protein